MRPEYEFAQRVYGQIREFDKKTAEALDERLINFVVELVLSGDVFIVSRQASFAKCIDETRYGVGKPLNRIELTASNLAYYQPFRRVRELEREVERFKKLLCDEIRRGKVLEHRLREAEKILSRKLACEPFYAQTPPPNPNEPGPSTPPVPPPRDSDSVEQAVDRILKSFIAERPIKAGEPVTAADIRPETRLERLKSSILCGARRFFHRGPTED